MKQQQKNKFSLKKLTIARINVNAMNHIKGGSSLPSGTRHTNDKPCLADD
ncbi:class I lanthipeptide [Aquimarina sp. 2201CG14-23]|nr:class I lanthipeptide [Aquimarina sp. 2201CG14-23]MDH7447392.1 class I lanthipeptide [Aquimarina sp. 2201CG14-23]